MAKPLLPDDLWELIEPLLPPPKPRRYRHPGRRPVTHRQALTGILFVLKTGIQWEDLPREMGCGCGMTCWRRLRDWHRAGVWDELHAVLLDRLAEADQINRSRASLDSASVPAPHAPKGSRSRGCSGGTEPDGPGQAGHQASPRRRRAGYSLGSSALGRQPQRLFQAVTAVVLGGLSPR